jgi:hypothetical protein
LLCRAVPDACFQELEAKTKTLSNAVTQLVVAARSNPKNVANMSKATQLAYHDVVLASNSAIGASPVRNIFRSFSLRHFISGDSSVLSF